jgi:hypothetical protein
MPNLTIKQAAIFTGRDEKTIRRWILGSAGKNPRIPSHAKDSRGRYVVAQSDLERILFEDALTSFDEPRLAELERRVAALERDLQETRATLERLTAAKTYHHAPAPPQSAVARPVGEALPDGWIPIVDLIKQYNKPETSVMRHMRPYLIAGSWKTSDGRTVSYALDAEGLAKFMEWYG